MRSPFQLSPDRPLSILIGILITHEERIQQSVRAFQYRLSLGIEARRVIEPIMKKRSKTRVRRSVILCKYAKPVKGKGNSEQTWAFTLADIASLLKLTLYQTKLLVNGRDRVYEGRGKIEPKLDPRDLEALHSYVERGRWEASTLDGYDPDRKAQALNELRTILDYLSLYRPCLGGALLLAIEAFRLHGAP